MPIADDAPLRGWRFLLLNVVLGLGNVLPLDRKVDVIADAATKGAGRILDDFQIVGRDGGRFSARRDHR